MLVSAALPAGLSIAAPVTQATPAATTPQSLKALVAKATKLARQVDALSEQYDGLRIQLNEAKTEAKIARQAAARDLKHLSARQLAVGQIAAEGYMTGGVDPALQLLQNSDPQAFINRASIMLQLQRENGDKVTVLTSAEKAAERAQLTAQQQAAKATRLSAEMNTRVKAIQAKENVLNGAAYKQAMQIFQQTGNYPNVPMPSGNTVGIQALRWALSQRGKPYIWGAAGPDAFDCSGLVMWSYAKVGISLDHFTGNQWNEGMHVSRSDLQPGDLMFFYSLGHVGMWIGNGLMVDAPHTGAFVEVAAVPWGALDGIVRIG